MWIIGRGNVIIIIFFRWCFFLEVESPRALPAAMVLYVREKRCLIDKLDKLLWTTLQTSVAIDSSALPSLRRGHLCANDAAYRTRHSAGTMRHGPFHCIAPRLTSLVHMASLRSKLHFRLSFPCTASDDTHQIDFTDLSHNISIVCMYVYVLAVCTEGYSWSTMAGLVYIFVLNGAILNLIFK